MQAKVKAVADEINEARREAEALTRIYELSCKIDHIGEMVCTNYLVLLLGVEKT